MIMNKDIELKKNQNLNSNLLAINKFIEGNNNENLLHFVKELHNADIADLIQNLDESKRVQLINNIKDDFDPEILTYLNESLREDLIDNLLQVINLKNNYILSPLNNLKRDLFSTTLYKPLEKIFSFL